MRCACGAHDLPPYSPWVALPSTVHTAARCGDVVELRVEGIAFSGYLRLEVWWKGEERPRSWIGT